MTKALEGAQGPKVAVSDWMHAVPEQIRPWVPGTYRTLGADGFGISDTRPAARRFFNTDAESVVVAVLEALADEGSVDRQVAVTAAAQYKIDDVSAADVSYKDTGSAWPLREHTQMCGFRADFRTFGHARSFVDTNCTNRYSRGRSLTSPGRNPPCGSPFSLAQHFWASA